MKENQIDVIVLTHNRVELLQKCLLSIRNSKNLDDYVMNVIVVDNASNDGTEEMIRNKFSNVTYIRNDKNLYPCISQWKGFSSSDGKYVMRVDDDNEIDENCIFNLIQPFLNDSKIALCGTIGITDSGELSTNIGSYFKGFLKLRYLPQFKKISDVGVEVYEVQSVDNVYCFLRSVVSMEEWKRPCQWISWSMEDLLQQFLANDRGYRIVINPKSLTKHHQISRTYPRPTLILGTLRSKIIVLKVHYKYRNVKLIFASLLFAILLYAHWVFNSPDKIKVVGKGIKIFRTLVDALSIDTNH